MIYTVLATAGNKALIMHQGGDVFRYAFGDRMTTYQRADHVGAFDPTPAVVWAYVGRTFESWDELRDWWDG